MERGINGPQKETGPAHTTRAIIEHAGGIACGIINLDSNDLEILSQLQSNWDNALQTINTHTHEDAKKAWVANQAAGADIIRKSGELAKHDFWTFEDFSQDYQGIIDAAKAEMVRASQEALPLAHKISVQFISLCNRIASEFEQSDHDRYDRYCVIYPGPSPVVSEIRKCAKIAAARTVAAPGGNSSPKSLLPYLADYL